MGGGTEMYSLHTSPEVRLACMRDVQSWTRRVRPIIASRQPLAKKREDLIAAGCSEKNAAYLAQLPVREFDIGNNSAARDRAIARIEMGIREVA